MRLLSLTVRNYRLHRDITVEFDAARNLIGGSNETGKSTLAEAMHRVLFFRHRSGGEPQRAMKSDTHNGHPEVKLVFEAAGRSWTLEKRFSGNSGTARLSSDDGTSLQNDAAEDKLAQLVGNADGPGTTLNQLSAHWAHLWVWQGTSGDDASVHAAARKDELVQRLQHHGLAAVMQSETDESVRETIRKAHDEIFTRTGTVKAGSKLDAATKALAEAGTALTRALEQKQRLAAAIADQQAAAKILAESTAALPGLNSQLAAVNDSLAQVSTLRASEEKEQLLHRNTLAIRENLVKADRQIRELRTQAATARESLIPAEAKLSILTDQESAAREASSTADLTHRSITDHVRLSRQLHDLAAACVSRFEKSAAFESLSARAGDIAAINEALTTDRESLSKLPAITGAELESLRKLDAQLGQAESALAAIAAGIELISSEQSILLDGKPLTLGSTQVITETAELTLGAGTRLRIQPGGGTSLAQSRRKASELRQSLTQALDRLTVRDLAEAVEIAARRQTLEQQIGTIESRLRDLGAKGMAEALATASIACSAAATEVERRRAALPADQIPKLPESIESARAWQTQASGILSESERTEKALFQEADAHRKAHQKHLDAVKSQRESIEADRTNLLNLDTSARILEENHGDEPTRNQTLESVRADEATAAQTLATTTARLAELNPESLGNHLARITRSIQQQQENQRAADTRSAVARNTLALDGSRDPDAELLQAKARHATLAGEHAREDRRAQAIALLHRLFTESQTAISENLTQPIADRVGGYLECLFGRGVRVRVDLANPARPSLQLTRSGTPAFAFEALSGGAKEQIAAALRLAMAEILADNHDGCLPVLFDDAFAYADPDRVQALQSMLDLAANRGLQVIVLTCSPADYVGLGAKEIRLYPAEA